MYQQSTTYFITTYLLGLLLPTMYYLYLRILGSTDYYVLLHTQTTTLTTAQEATLSSVEVDATKDEDRRLQGRSDALAEQRIQGASLLLDDVSAQSRSHVDSWIRRRPTYFLTTSKFTSLTDLYNAGAAADALDVVDFSHKEPQYGAPTSSQFTALKNYICATQRVHETLSVAAPALYRSVNEVNLELVKKYVGRLRIHESM